MKSSLSKLPRAEARGIFFLARFGYHPIGQWPKGFLARNKYIWLLLILALAFALRFYQLGQNPPHLNWDEASNSYNANSILKTGKDEYGRFMPVLFKSFGDYNLALSVYPIVPSIAIFGLNQFAVRLPSALFGVVFVLFTYLLTLKLLKNRFTALMAAFLIAISPWHLQFSRYDHEANFMQTFILVGLTAYFYLRKKITGLILLVLFFGLALNSYHGAKVWVPVLLLFMTIFDRKNILKFKFKLILPALILFAFCLPIIANFQNSLIRGQSVGITSQKQPISTFVSGYLDHYSLNFLFNAGDTIGRHAVTGMGELYVFELPLILLGIIAVVARKEKLPKFLLGWLLLAAIPAALATPTPHALRAITFLPVWDIFATIGIYAIKTAKLARWTKATVFLVIGVIGLYNFITYLHLYYSHYPRQRAVDWQDGHRQVFAYIKEHESEYNSIAISNYYGHPYIFALFYLGYDPALYRPQKDGQNGFGKYEFFGSSWSQTVPGKALIVTPFWQAHPPKVLKQIYTADRDLRYIISETQ